MSARSVSLLFVLVFFHVSVFQARQAAFGQAQPSLPRDFEFQLPLFSPDSAWNQKAAGAAVLPGSEDQILVMFRSLLGDPADLHPDGYFLSYAPALHMGIDSGDWTIPIYRMGTGENTVLLKEYEGGPGSTNPNLGSHWGGSITVPAPAGSLQPSGPRAIFSDGHVVLYNPDTGMSYDYWQATTALDDQNNTLGGGQIGTAILWAGARDWVAAAAAAAPKRRMNLFLLIPAISLYLRFAARPSKMPSRKGRAIPNSQPLTPNP